MRMMLLSISMDKIKLFFNQKIIVAYEEIFFMNIELMKIKNMKKIFKQKNNMSTEV
jgi:hypothetical protein